MTWQPGTGRFALQAPAAPAVAAAAAPSAPAPRSLCAGHPACYDGQRFSAQVVRVVVVTCRNRADAVALLTTVRVLNASAEPLVLTYDAGSVRAVDDQGLRWSPPGACEDEVRGMGMASASRVDGDFQLAPGETREATLGAFLQMRSHQPRGNTFDLDFALGEYAALPGRQLKRLRTHSISFNGLPASTGPAARGPAASKPPQGAAKDLHDALDMLKQFRK